MATFSLSSEFLSHRNCQISCPKKGEKRHNPTFLYFFPPSPFSSVVWQTNYFSLGGGGGRGGKAATKIFFSPSLAKLWRGGKEGKWKKTSTWEKGVRYQKRRESVIAWHYFISHLTVSKIDTRNKREEEKWRRRRRGFRCSFCGFVRPLCVCNQYTICARRFGTHKRRKCQTLRRRLDRRKDGKILSWHRNTAVKAEK